MRLINAIQAIDNLDAKIKDDDTSERAMGILEAINELGRMNCEEAIEAEPVRHGKWLKNNNGTYTCSECKSWIPNEQHYYARYCLFCGAKMEKENEIS